MEILPQGEDIEEVLQEGMCALMQAGGPGYLGDMVIGGYCRQMMIEKGDRGGDRRGMVMALLFQSLP